MNLSDVGSWASIIGLIITIITFCLASKVNKKVSKIVKTKCDRTYFSQKVSVAINGLKEVKEMAEESCAYLYATKQFSKINSAIELTISSWDVLYQYSSFVIKQMKIALWNRKFKKIKDMYNLSGTKNTNELVKFLNEFITFLEKEQSNNE